MSPFDTAWGLLKSNTLKAPLPAEWGPPPETGEWSPVSTHPPVPAPPGNFTEPSIDELSQGNIPMGQLNQLSPEDLAFLRLKGQLPPESQVPQQVETEAMAPDLPPGQGQLPRGAPPNWTAQSLAAQHARDRLRETR